MATLYSSCPASGGRGIPDGELRATRKPMKSSRIDGPLPYRSADRQYLAEYHQLPPCLQQHEASVAADETSAAGDQDALGPGCHWHGKGN